MYLCEYSQLVSITKYMNEEISLKIRLPLVVEQYFKLPQMIKG